eukprot:18241-Rhodomonas_salina.2
MAPCGLPGARSDGNACQCGEQELRPEKGLRMQQVHPPFLSRRVLGHVEGRAQLHQVRGGSGGNYSS